MRYFQISVSSEPNIIGVKNGVYQLEIDNKVFINDGKYRDFQNWFSYKNLDFWNQQDKIIQLEKPQIEGKMLQKAKTTDIMGYAPEYYNLHNVYSEKYINVLQKFNSNIQNIFPVKIENIQIIYYLMFIKTITTQEINFEKSIVYSGHKILKNLKYHSVNTYKEFSELLEDKPLATYEKIAISKEYYGQDVISIQASGGHFYSEKLIDFLLESAITGLHIRYENSIELGFV